MTHGGRRTAAGPALLLAFLALVLAAPLGCSRQKPGSSAPEPASGFILASNAALESWAAFLLGDGFSVELPNNSPLAGAPLPSDEAFRDRLRRARLVLVYGDAADDPLASAARRAGLETRLRELRPDDTVGSFHWLNPTEARSDAARLAKLLSTEFPEERSAVLSRHEELDALLEGLERQAQAVAVELPKGSVFVPDTRATPYLESLGLSPAGRLSPRPGAAAGAEDVRAFEAAVRDAANPVYLEYADEPTGGLAQQAGELDLHVVGFDPLRRGDASLDLYEMRLRRNWRNTALSLVAATERVASQTQPSN